MVVLYYSSNLNWFHQITMNVTSQLDAAYNHQTHLPNALVTVTDDDVAGLYLSQTKM